MFKTTFLQKKTSIILKPLDRFFSIPGKKSSELSSFICASLKAIATIELAGQIAGQI